MKKVMVFSVLFIGSLFCHAQVDTGLIKARKGLLFLTDYNYQYDYKEGEEMRPLGFHDFFFPLKSFDLRLLMDSGRQINFQNGIRIDFIKDRKVIKDRAIAFNGKDTSRCYGFDRFYLVPAIIDYKAIKEYEPYVCRRNYFDIKIERGGALHFEYLHQAIKPTKIIVQTDPKRSNTKKRKK